MQADRDRKQYEIRGSLNFCYESGLICSISRLEFIILENKSSILRAV